MCQLPYASHDYRPFRLDCRLTGNTGPEPAKVLAFHDRVLVLPTNVRLLRTS